jgi:uncharacterized protein YllA (UPF0747 family)
VTAGPLAARALVAAPPAPSAIADAFTLDLLSGGPLSRERVPVSWRDTAALTALAQRKRAPLDAGLAAALEEQHRRLGASPASLANLARLARGEAVAAVAGQQPAPLGGPLFALHKTAGAVGLAAAATERTGVPCVPLFWMHGEDSDFAEVRGVTVADAQLVLHDLQLPAEAHAEGGMVGALPLETLRAVGEEAIAHWSGLPFQAEALARFRGSLANARDLGEAVSALWLSLFAEQGLVVVDPRLPAFRAAARPVIERYLADAESLQRAAREAGERLERASGRRPLPDASLESFVFEVDGARRRKIAAADARARGPAVTLSPSVALRPAVQDGVFPTVAMACGPGEIAYLMQLREVFAGVGVEPAAPAVRFGASWLPAAAFELAEAAGADAWEVVTHTDAVLARVAERRVPTALHEALADARISVEQSLARLAEASREFDGSLPQLVESARGKMDFQVSRLAEGVLGKARGRLDRDHPLWRRLRPLLLPGDKLQERRLASLEPVARRGAGVIRDLCALATAHAHRTAEGVHEHALLEA